MRIAGEAIQRSQTGSGTVDHRQRNHVTETGHRAVLESKQQLVERQDLSPVGFVGARRFVVERGNRRLNLVGTGRAARKRTLQDLSAFRHAPLIP